MPVSLNQLKQQLEASSLMTLAEIDAAISGPDVDLPPKNGEELVRLLVKQQKLTAYQARQIYSGKGKSLVMGNYTILDKLGQGGMGTVLKAKHQRMDRIVALKILSPSLTNNPESVRRFQREVKAAARLEHPNIVTAYDADDANGKHFLVMQYVDGTDLSVFVKRQGPLPVEKAVVWVLQAARGLHYAHQQRVVHRDIKPANLLIDSSGTVKILDMGLARLDSGGAEQDELTGTGQVMGTVDYMAPEQAVDTKNADARADIYSLGATLWYLLTGRALYTGASVVMKLVAHQNLPIPSLSRACPHASAELEAVLAKMVAKTPESRYQSMTEVIADLERCSGSYSIPSLSATAPGVDDRLSEFLRGKRSSPEQAVVTKTSVKKSVKSMASSRTMATSSREVSTDAQMQPSRLTSPGVQPAREFQTDSRWWQRRSTQIAVGGSSLLLLLAAIVFFVKVKDGMIRVEINDPEIEVAIKGTGIVLKQADQGTDVKLAPGEHTLIVQRGDFQFETDKLILKRGETVAVKVELLAGQVEIHKGDVLLGQARLPMAQTAVSDSWDGWPKDAPPPAIAPFNAAQAKAHQEIWAQHLGVPAEYTNSIGMKFRLIPPGEFMMGSTESEVDEALKVAGEDKLWQEFVRSEVPLHKVILTRPVYFGVHEVTQGQYERVMGNNPSNFSSYGAARDAVAGMDTTRHPVEMVSWNDATEFCTRICALELHEPFSARHDMNQTSPVTGYRLPTEAEWEFTCRAGTTTKFWIGDRDEDILQTAWTNMGSGNRTHAVGELRANPFGLFDLTGNVWEWVEDLWSPAAYVQFSSKFYIDPHVSSSTSSNRSIRGGGFTYYPSNCRSSHRFSNAQAGRYGNCGFRIVLTVDAVRQLMKSQTMNSENEATDESLIPAPAKRDVPGEASDPEAAIKNPHDGADKANDVLPLSAPQSNSPKDSLTFEESYPVWPAVIAYYVHSPGQAVVEMNNLSIREMGPEPRTP